MEESRIRQQSEAAYKQWCEQWRRHCLAHKDFKKISFAEYENIGIGKALLCVANGYSFEENIETIKKYQKNVDILACDKTMGHLLDNGIIPTYVLVCDANVNYAKYMEKWKDKLSKTTLFINACANPEWSHNGNWKEIVFFVNMDIIDSHSEFSKLSGTTNMIPAGTNVSNAMVILATQCTNGQPKNFFGYDKILLIGFDYSWKFDGKYYAFDKDGGGKTYYMRHSCITTVSGKEAYSSGNLAFSMEWLLSYVKTFKLPIVQCGKDSLFMPNGKASDLEKQMQYKFRPEDKDKVKSTLAELRRIMKQKQNLEGFLHNIGRDHHWSYVQTT